MTTTKAPKDNYYGYIIAWLLLAIVMFLIMRACTSCVPVRDVVDDSDVQYTEYFPGADTNRCFTVKQDLK